MALFGFGKKKEEAPQRPRVPVDEVVRMRRQGLNNNQIVQALQRNGFQTSQIFDAFNQADLRAPSPMQGMQQGMQGMPFRQPQNQPQHTEHMEAGPENFLGAPPNVPPEAETIEGSQSSEELGSFGDQGTDQGSAEMPGMPAAVPGYGSAAPAGYGSHDVSAKIEEISEAIIEEKWQDLMKDYNKLVEWKSSVEQRMAAVEQRLNDLKAAFDSLQKSVVDKVSDYDKSVKDVSSEMKALEQVFQKIIPTLTENVNELSRITKGMKPSSAKK